MESDTELARELSFHTYVFSCAESKMKISLITNFRNYRTNRLPLLPPIYSALSINCGLKNSPSSSGRSFEGLRISIIKTLFLHSISTCE